MLLTPLVVIFGAGFFLTLIDQMNMPARAGALSGSSPCSWRSSGSRWSRPWSTKASTVAYPPYYPPDMQQIAGWMHPDELMMSDIPWAVAWYGDRQCAWTTLNSAMNFSSSTTCTGRSMRFT